MATTKALAPIVPHRRLPPPTRRTTGRCKRVTVMSGKGGPGKSTTSRQLAYRLAAEGDAVLFGEVEYNTRQLSTLAGLSAYAGQTVDNNSTTWALFTRPEVASGLEPIQIDVPTLLAPLDSHLRATWGWQHPQVLEYIPGSKSLRSLDNRVTFANASSSTKDFDPQTQYVRGVDAVAERYDWWISDTPPVTGLVQRNAIAASDYVVLVADFDTDTIEDVTLTLEFFYDVVASLRALDRPAPQLLGVVYNKYDASEPVDIELLHLYRHAHYGSEESGDELLPPLIDLQELGLLRFDKATTKRADRARLPIEVYSPNAPIVGDYEVFCKTLRQAIAQHPVVA